jgi:hypothetical protein
VELLSYGHSTEAKTNGLDSSKEKVTKLPIAAAFCLLGLPFNLEDGGNTFL